jgi:heptose I phosphotransferase
MPPTLAILLAACLLLGFAGLLRARGRRGRGRGFVAFRPGWRVFLRGHGLLDARGFLHVSAPIISGHPGRSVARVVLTAGETSLTAYLKRETHLSWPDRLASAAAGFGFASRSLREARALDALAREGVGCPEWLAVGEDGCGGAFLLVRETPGATELRSWLARERHPAARRRLARSLGRALAHMHAAGFSHPDLYSKHVLVTAGGASVQFLDWQRGRRLLRLGRRRRARDLAALHATLADELAAPRERLACWRAYCAAFDGPAAPRTLLRLVLHSARRLLRKRHVREKRGRPLDRGVQEWRTACGGEVCATPALEAAWPGRPPEWLAEALSPGPGGASFRRWLPAADGAPTLLVRQSRRPTAGDWWRRLWGRPPTTAEQRRAELLLRLQRHGIEAPHVLAMGRREAAGRVESFLLTRPAGGAVRLAAWLARQPGPARRRAVLGAAGALLRRLHDAACCLDGRGPAEALAVRMPAGGPPEVLVAAVEHLQPLRQRSARRARHDLAAAGALGEADLRRFLAGYHDAAAAGGAAGARPPTAGTLFAQWRSNGHLKGASAGSLWSRLVAGVRRVRQRPEWPRFAGSDWADRIMDAPVTDRFQAKQGRTTGRLVLGADGPGPRRLAVYLKRHYAAPWRDRLLAALGAGGGRSPAFREWDHLEWARRAGVPAPRPVAAAEFVGPWGRLRGALAVEELPDMLPLSEAVPLAAARLAPADFRRWKRGLIAETARLTRLLHDRRRFHKDLYLCHFFIPRADTADPDPAWRGRVHLIDLHRLGRHPWAWLWWRIKDLAQLLYSSEAPGVAAADRLRFWRAYRGPGPRRAADRWLLRLVLFKWGRYRRHNARQRARGRGARGGEGGAGAS